MINGSLIEKKKNLKELVKADNLKNIKTSFDSANIMLNLLTTLSN